MVLSFRKSDPFAPLPRKIASAVIDGKASLAISETKKTGSFTLPGIGKLVLQKRKARDGTNPATGEAIKISVRTVVKMRIAKACKEAIVPVREGSRYLNLTLRI